MSLTYIKEAFGKEYIKIYSRFTKKGIFPSPGKEFQIYSEVKVMLQAMKKYENNKWWLYTELKDKLYFQLKDPVLLIPIDYLQYCAEMVLGRNVPISYLKSRKGKSALLREMRNKGLIPIINEV